MPALTCQVAIVGAGPYGLAAAAHLRSKNVELCVFGNAMEFWERQMPAGMLLRSYWEGSHISDANGELTLDQYQRVRGAPLARPIRLEDFIGYGRWFQHQAVPDLDSRRVARIERESKSFRLTLEDGESVRAQHVVIATGIGSFAHCPSQFRGMPLALVSHSSQHRDLSRFNGQRVLVVGGGQSALESATLLSESGAVVEVIARAPKVHWLRYGTRVHSWLHSPGNPFRWALYPPSDIGPPGVNWLIDTPALLVRLPFAIRSRVEKRAIRPAGAGWLRSRIEGVTIMTNRAVVAASVAGQQVRLRLNDGSERCVDHVLLATGYRVDISRCAFLAPKLLRSLRITNGYPALTAGFEASVPRLHFLGGPAAGTFGPLMLFVAGTKYAATRLTRCVVGRAATPSTSKVASHTDAIATAVLHPWMNSEDEPPASEGGR
jgi:FAD-dependent urate hydroxylase